MSLTSFVELPDIAQRLNALLPETPKLAGVVTRAEPVTQNYSAVGTAIDYAIRFELERRCPHALTRAWMAEEALDRLPLALLRVPKKIARARTQECRDVVQRARCFHATFVCNPTPSRADWRELAEHALRLATLDIVYRVGRLFPLAANDRDVADVLALLDVVPWEHFVHDSILWLNPTFGSSSELVGGADADLLSGRTLIDIKARKRTAIERKDLRQLVGYLILARQEDAAFAEIGTIAIYLARQAYLWSMPAAMVAGNVAYAETEEWFIARAREEQAHRDKNGRDVRITIGPTA